MNYRLNDFDYTLPEGLIAQEPASPRDHARLLVFNRKEGTITDDHFYNLGTHLHPGTTLVANNSRVEKCRLLFNDGAVELFVVSRLNDRMVEALVRPGKKFRPGKQIRLADGIEIETLSVSDDGIRTLRLNRPLDDPLFDPWKATPFPPYIRQNEALADEYQTVFARDEGSKAAPTAGLHFTDELIGRLKGIGFSWEEVTLHVGLGTFAPVKEENLDRHIMHREWYRIDRKTADGLNSASHITAVGTTGVRVLESAVREQPPAGGSTDTPSRRFDPCSGETALFIRPGYRFRAVDSLVTNFHLPKSTLLMLVSAFAGMEETRALYEHAIREKYRFYSFGDAMLIL